MRLPGWIMASLATAALMILISLTIYDMRPIPKYHPQDYQHLVGRNLRHAQSELDTRHSGAGAVKRGGVSYRYLSFRGMVIVADPDGTITEIKENRRD